jgi:ArsR family transcriptional regulator, zinc-responsive transcriptional repressor
MVKRPAELSEQDLEQLSSLFRLLADKTRLSILLALADGERNVTSLCEELSLPQPTVSHHLGLLRMNNVVSNRRNGKQVFYVLHGTPGLRNGTVMEFLVQNLHIEVKHRARD